MVSILTPVEEVSLNAAIERPKKEPKTNFQLVAPVLMRIFSRKTLLTPKNLLKVKQHKCRAHTHK
jgi:hypothetical protein